MSEIDYSEYDREQLIRFLHLRDRQARVSREYWVRAARRAFGGDDRELRNRVELAEAGPVEIVLSSDPTP